jgi:phosphatidylinositol glycan class N
MVRPPSFVRTLDSHGSAELKKAHAILYKPYQSLDHPSSVLEYPGSRPLSFIESLIASGRFQEARHHSHELIKTTLVGIRYLETYNRTLIRTIVTFAYTGWIAFSAAYILVPSRPPLVSTLRTTVFFSTATIASCVFFAIQKLPWTLHIYILFPFYFWHEVAIRVSVVSSVVRNHKLGTSWIANAALGLVLVVAALQSMVVRRLAPSL